MPLIGELPDTCFPRLTLPPLHASSRLHSANADSTQTSWRRAGGAAGGERRGGCATVTEPTETAEIANLRVKANAGDADAQFTLGYAYANGEGVSQDYAQAVAWYRKAAEQGDAMAQWVLGLAYQLGQGVPQDYVESHKWRNLAASRASAELRKRFAEGRDALAKVMTPTQIEAAQTLAREWMAAFQKRGGK